MVTMDQAAFPKDMRSLASVKSEGSKAVISLVRRRIEAARRHAIFRRSGKYEPSRVTRQPKGSERRGRRVCTHELLKVRDCRVPRGGAVLPCGQRLVQDRTGVICRSSDRYRFSRACGGGR